MLVGRFDAVARISRLVQCQEEFLRVAIEPALTSLIGRDLGKRVVAAFLADIQLERPQIAAERSRARGVPAALHPDLGKEFVGDSQYIHRRQLSPKKMTHVESGSRFAGGTHRLNPIDALERHARILIATELNRGRPVTARRVEEMSRVCA